LADVPEYRAGADRSGVYPGPGPVAKPVPLWTRTASAAIALNPVLGNGVLITGDLAGHVYGLDGRTGIELWRVDYPSDTAASISYADGMAFVLDINGVLHALDVATGSERWGRQVDSGFRADVGRGTDVANGVVYISDGQTRMLGLDTATGEQVWSYRGSSPMGVATVSNGHLYAQLAGGGLAAVSIPDSTLLWTFQSISNAGGVPIVGEDTVFFNALQGQNEEPSGELYALDPDTGEVRWRFRSTSQYQVSLGAVADGVLYAGSQADGMFAFPVEAAVDGSSVVPAWNASLPGPNFRNSALVGDILYVPVADPGSLNAIRTSDGALLWSLPLDGAAGAPLVSGGELFVVDDTGTIAAYVEPSLAESVASVGNGALSAPQAPGEPGGLPDPLTLQTTLTPDVTGLSSIIYYDTGPDGMVYVIDDKNRLVIIDPDSGGVVGGWGELGTLPGQFDFRTNDGNPGHGAVAVALDGRVYVGEGANHRYQVFAPDGTFIQQVGSFGTHEGQFNVLNSMAVDADGNVYAVDEHVQKFGPDGGFLWRAGGPATTGPLGGGAFHDTVPMADGTVLQGMEDRHIAQLDATTGDVLGTLDDLPITATFDVDSAGDVFSTGDDLKVNNRDHRLIAESPGFVTDYGWAFRLLPDGRLVTSRDATIYVFDVTLPGE
jgi:outer membrane protein assembly factor BamB